MVLGIVFPCLSFVHFNKQLNKQSKCSLGALFALVLFILTPTQISWAQATLPVDIQQQLDNINSAGPEDEQKVMAIIEQSDGAMLVKAKLKLASIYRRSSQHELAETLLTELLTNVDTYEKELQISVHRSFATSLRSQNKYAEAASYMESVVLPLAKPDSAQLARAYQSTGVFYRLQMKLLEAKDYYLLALERYQLTKDKKGEADVYASLGVLYEAEGDLVLAAEYQIKALNYFEAKNDINALAFNYFNLGELYYKSNDLDKSLNFYQTALRYDLQLNNLQDVGYDYHRIGSIYLKKTELEKAVDYTEKAIDIFKQHAAYQVLSRSYLQMAEINEQLEDNTARYNNLMLAQKAAELTPSEHQTRQVMHDQGIYYFDIKSYQQAKTRLEKSLEISVKLNLFDDQLEDNELLSKIHQELGEHELAFKHLQDAYTLKQKLDSEQRIKEVERHKRDINLLEEQVKVANLEEQKYQAEQELIDQKAMNIIILFIALFLLILVATAFYILMQKRRLALLEAKLYEDALAQKNQLLADVSHELRTPLTALKLQVDSLRYQLVDDVDLSYQRLSTKITDLNHLISDIYELALTDVDGLSMSLETLDIIPKLNLWQEEFKGYVESSGFEWLFECSIEHATIEVDVDRLKQVCTNLISNSCKYTDKPGTINLKIKIKHNVLTLVVQDTAPGVPDDELDKIFERLYRVEKSRNRSTGGAGLGLAISQNIINAHHGSIVARQSRIGGLAVIVKIPLVH